LVLKLRIQTGVDAGARQLLLCYSLPCEMCDLGVCWIALYFSFLVAGVSFLIFGLVSLLQVSTFLAYLECVLLLSVWWMRF
jgi:hypothetical protein